MKRKSMNANGLDGQIDITQVTQMYKDLARKKSFGENNSQQASLRNSRDLVQSQKNSPK
jgi:hypothetical protein